MYQRKCCLTGKKAKFYAHEYMCIHSIRTCSMANDDDTDPIQRQQDLVYVPEDRRWLYNYDSKLYIPFTEMIRNLSSGLEYDLLVIKRPFDWDRPDIHRNLKGIWGEMSLAKW